MKMAGWLGSAAGLLCLGIALGTASDARATTMPVLPIQATGPTLFSPWWAYQGYGSPGYMSQPAFTTASDAGGSLIASLTNAPFTSNNLQFSGTLTTQVVRNDTSNPYENGTILSIPGALTFIFTLANNATTDLNADAAISRISLNSWGGFDAYAVEAGSGTAGAYITRSGSANLNGDVLGVNYLNNPTSGVRAGNPFPGTTPLNAGQSGMEVIIYTNATNYVSTSAALIGGSDTSSVPTFSPALPPLPEPGSLVLASIGAAALGLVAWRRRRRHA